VCGSPLVDVRPRSRLAFEEDDVAVVGDVEGPPYFTERR
jgi:hypothetical protein